MSSVVSGTARPAKNLVQWGPIIAGVITAIAVLVLLTVLGLAVGASALEPRDSGESIGTFAAIWGGVSAIVAFFVGGVVSARSASVAGQGGALINGFLVGASVLVLVLFLAGSGVGSLFGTIGNNIDTIADVVQQEADENNVTQEDVEQQADEATDEVKSNADEAFEKAEDASWGTLLGLILAHGAAAAGGLVGANSRRDLSERAAE